VRVVAAGICRGAWLSESLTRLDGSRCDGSKFFLVAAGD
jgi:hypothetical protein